MAEGSDNKTEQPSQRKLSHAREQGQVIQSREINSFFMLTTGAVIALLLAPSLAHRLDVTLTRFLDPAGLVDDGGILWEAVINLMRGIAGAMILPLILLVATAIGGSVMQTGLVIASEKIGFDLSRLSLLSGASRLFSPRAAMEFIKNLIKVAIILAIAGWTVLPEIGRLPLLTSFGAAAVAAEIHRLLLHLTLALLALIALLALLDYGWQRFSFLRSMRMSKQEIKEEHKQAEGDPMVKARLRHIRMERTRRRMMAAVPKASVVITNPTHFAVALTYDLGDKGAPRVVAKGADLIALKIREIAEEHGVPVVENPPVARALYASVEIDQEIPPEQYRAVAEIISYVFRLQGKLQPA